MIVAERNVSQRRTHISGAVEVEGFETVVKQQRATQCKYRMVVDSLVGVC